MNQAHRPSTDLGRRHFVQLAGLFAAGGILNGCAANPVTGGSQLMLVSRDQEINIDRQRSPHQFSADYGPIQDRRLQDYIQRTGHKLARLTHRPDMPYSFQGVNAVYVNAYAFPGGSIGLTRGILLELDNEAQLAALIGHELAHVNARHTASQMSKGMLVSAMLSGAGLALQGNETYSRILSGLGGIAAGALLASYSRSNEREADDLGLEYMVRAGYSPVGMIGLQDMLRNLSKHQPKALELMFSTHPMSAERYATAKEKAHGKYRPGLANPVHRDRYLDHTAKLRRHRPVIKGLQEGQKYMAKQQFSQAEDAFATSLQIAPQDYAGLVMQGNCFLAQKQYARAQQVAQRAKAAYPQEAQARHLSGVSRLAADKFESALVDFQNYERLLPGNPSNLFLQGLCFEGMQKIEPAASKYAQFLSRVNRGKQAEYAYTRLKQWGYR